MGVISKGSNEKSFEIRSSISEETLYIPSSDDDRSEASIAIRHARSRILPRNRRAPTVGPSIGSLSPHSGKKKSRRYQNVSQLMTLAEEGELEEVTINDFVDSKSRFSRLFDDNQSFQKWEEFVSSSEEIQEKLINAQKPTMQSTSENKSKCERRLSGTLRTLLKKRCLPFGMVQYLEGELVQFFVTMPRDIYVSPELSCFERMLLHSLSDYHSLVSLSFNAEPKKVRLVKVQNPKDEFESPNMLLTDYLQKMCDTRTLKVSTHDMFYPSDLPKKPWQRPSGSKANITNSKSASGKKHTSQIGVSDV